MFKRTIFYFITIFVSNLSPIVYADNASPDTPTVASFTPSEITDWQSPTALLPGTYHYILQGNPSGPGVYTVRLKLPANYVIAPYFQNTTTYMTVVSGDFHLGVGDKFDSSKGKELPAGSFITIPANVNVYAWTSKETVLQIHGIGPWGVTYLVDMKNPSNKSAS